MLNELKSVGSTRVDVQLQAECIRAKTQMPCEDSSRRDLFKLFASFRKVDMDKRMLKMFFNFMRMDWCSKLSSQIHNIKSKLIEIIRHSLNPFTH